MLKILLSSILLTVVSSCATGDIATGTNESAITLREKAYEECLLANKKLSDQQAIDLCSKIFSNTGVETNAFKALGPKVSSW
jgi:hypothetical protein